MEALNTQPLYTWENNDQHYKRLNQKEKEIANKFNKDLYMLQGVLANIDEIYDLKNAKKIPLDKIQEYQDLYLDVAINMYTEGIRNGLIWGGLLEIRILEEVFNFKVFIFDYQDFKWMNSQGKEVSFYSCQGCKNAIYLLFEDKCHYNALERAQFDLDSIIKVGADGNCLFNSILAGARAMKIESILANVKTQQQLRKFIAQTYETGEYRKTIKQQIQNIADGKDFYRGGGFFEGLWEGVKNVGKAVGNAVQGKFDEVGKNLADAGKGVVSAVPIVGPATARAMDGKGFKITAEDVLDGVLDIAAVAAPGAGLVGQAAKQGAKMAGKQIVKGAVKGAIREGGKQVGKGVMNQGGRAVQQAGRGVQQGVVQGARGVQQGAVQGARGLGQGAQRMMDFGANAARYARHVQAVLRGGQQVARVVGNSGSGGSSGSGTGGQGGNSSSSNGGRNGVSGGQDGDDPRRNKWNAGNIAGSCRKDSPREINTMEELEEFLKAVKEYGKKNKNRSFNQGQWWITLSPQLRRQMQAQYSKNGQRQGARKWLDNNWREVVSDSSDTGFSLHYTVNHNGRKLFDLNVHIQDYQKHHRPDRGGGGGGHNVQMRMLAQQQSIGSSSTTSGINDDRSSSNNNGTSQIDTDRNNYGGNGNRSSQYGIGFGFGLGPFSSMFRTSQYRNNTNNNSSIVSLTTQYRTGSVIMDRMLNNPSSNEFAVRIFYPGQQYGYNSEIGVRYGNICFY